MNYASIAQFDMHRVSLTKICLKLVLHGVTDM